MKKLIIFVTMLLFIVACTAKPVEDCMAVEFTGIANQKIDYGTNANVYGLTQKSISFWVYLDSVSANVYRIISLFDDTAPYTEEGWGVALGVDGSGDLLFSQNFSVQEGQWSIPVGTLATGAWYNIIIAFDDSSAVNNPSFYVNGSLVANVEDLTPSGSTATGTNGALRIGSSGTGTLTLDGLIQDVRIYNRILSASEIEILANSKCMKTVMNGLVFWAPMWGTNDQSFDGLTLTSSHIITDWINGAVGTPAGSPIGRGNTIQPLK